MRVALNGWFWNRPETGSGQYLRRLSYALSQLAPQSEFVIFLPTDTPEDKPSNLHFVKVPSGQDSLRKLWWEQKLMPRMAFKHRADLLHIPYWAPPMFSKIPTVVTVHDLIPLLMPEYHGNALVRLYTAFVSATTPKVTMILTDSHASQVDIQRHLHIPDSKIHAIHLAVDNIYHSGHESDDIGILHNVAIEPGYVLYLGGFDRRKNLGTVITAYKMVKNSCPDSVLVIAGKLPQSDTHFTPDPRNLATEAGLKENDIVFLGYVPESMKPALYRNARVFIFPSLYEGFGYPPLEALSCGVPVVGSHTSSLPEVVGDAGVLLPPSDVKGLAGAIIQILTDSTFHAELSKRALHQAKLFSWKNTAAMTFAAYHEAINLYHSIN